MILKLIRIGCVVIPLGSFLIAIQFNNKYVVYSVVPLTVLIVSLLFYLERKAEKPSQIFEKPKYLIAIFGLAIGFFLYSEFLK